MSFSPLGSIASFVDSDRTVAGLQGYIGPVNTKWSVSHLQFDPSSLAYLYRHLGRDDPVNQETDGALLCHSLIDVRGDILDTHVVDTCLTLTILSS